MPRTFERFSGLMAQLITKGRIQAPDGGATLMRITDAPIFGCLPKGAPIIQISSKGHLVENPVPFLQDQVLASGKEMVAVLHTSPAVTPALSTKVA